MKRFIIIALALHLPLFADELRLKSGKTIEWVTLRDLGDSYEVETPKGTKIMVKKDDVDGFEKKKSEILTGATFTFDKKKVETIELLKTIDLKNDEITGTWKIMGGALLGGTTDAKIVSKLPLPSFASVPEEYDLAIDLTRKDGDDWVAIGLIGGGKQFAFCFDAWEGNWSGPILVDGKGLQKNENGLAISGKVFAVGKPHAVVFMVRKEALIVKVDGKDYFTWRADWNRVSLDPVLSISGKNILSLSAHKSVWTILKMTLTSPKN